MSPRDEDTMRQLQEIDETGDPDDDDDETGEPEDTRAWRRETGMTAAQERRLAEELIRFQPQAEDIEADLERIKREHGGRLTHKDIAGLTHQRAIELGEKYREFERKREEMARRRRPIKRPEAVHPEFAAREDEVYRAFKRHNRGERIVRQPGYYRGVVEVVFNVEPNGAGGAVAYIDGTASAKGTSFPFLAEYVGQQSTRLGGAYTVTSNDTNLSQPSATSYVNEIFLMKQIKGTFMGFRQLYAAGDITSMAVGAYTTKAVNGTALTMDDDGLIVPREFWNPYTDECELARALAIGSTLQLSWNDEGAGNSSDARTIEVCQFADVPHMGRKSFAETSGAARVLDMKRGGYWWCQNQTYQLSKDDGGNGLMTGYINVPGLVEFAFQPIHIGSSGIVVPQKVALDWQVTIYGDGFWPSGSSRRRRAE